MTSFQINEGRWSNIYQWAKPPRGVKVALQKSHQKKPMKNTGLILEGKIKDNLFLGSTGNDNLIVNEKKDWTPYLPDTEYQRKAFDTWNCVAFSACNVLEIYFNWAIKNKKISSVNLTWLIEKGYIENGRINFSDRFIGTKAGTKVGVGNSGSKVANTIHTHGLVPEKAWSFGLNMDEQEYYKNTPPELDILGKEFLTRFDIRFESFWIKDTSEALQYSPLQVFVNAWYKKNGVYYNPNKKINHAVTKIKEKTKQIFDTYDPFIKSLISNYYYYPSGYKYSFNEIINHMNIEEFLRDNDLLFVRNTKTGKFGRIMQEKLKVVETQDRGTLLLLDEAVRKNGRGLTEDEWEQLPKEKF